MVRVCSFSTAVPPNFSLVAQGRATSEVPLALSGACSFRFTVSPSFQFRGARTCQVGGATLTGKICSFRLTTSHRFSLLVQGRVKSEVPPRMLKGSRSPSVTSRWQQTPSAHKVEEIPGGPIATVALHEKNLSSLVFWARERSATPRALRCRLAVGQTPPKWASRLPKRPCAAREVSTRMSRLHHGLCKHKKE